MSFPLFREELGADLTYAALKGFSHYPCLHKVERLVVEGPGMRTVGKEQKPQAPALPPCFPSLADGLRRHRRPEDRLPYAAALDDHHHEPRLPASQMPVLRRRPASSTVRAQAEAAIIVVSNHSLLFCDLAADGGLPAPSAIGWWMRAHSAESEARRAFSLELAEEDILSLARRVASEESRRNVFVRAERTVVMPGNESRRRCSMGSRGRRAVRR